MTMKIRFGIILLMAAFIATPVFASDAAKTDSDTSAQTSAEADKTAGSDAKAADSSAEGSSTDAPAVSTLD